MGTFAEAETALLVAGSVTDDLPGETRDKLAKVSFLDDAVLVGRNLEVLLAQRRRAKPT